MVHKETRRNQLDSLIRMFKIFSCNYVHICWIYKTLIKYISELSHLNILFLIFLFPEQHWTENRFYPKVSVVSVEINGSHYFRSISRSCTNTHIHIHGYWIYWFCSDDDYWERESLGGAVAIVVGCDIVVSEFELQSHYYVLFRAWEDMTPTYTPSYGSLNSTTTVFLQEWLWHYISSQTWYAIKQRNLTRNCLFCPQNVYFSLVFYRKYFYWHFIEQCYFTRLILTTYSSANIEKFHPIMSYTLIKYIMILCFKKLI